MKIKSAGRRFLMRWLFTLGCVILLSASGSVLGLGVGSNAIPYIEDFESATYTNGYLIVDNSVTGWYSDAPDAVQVITNLLGLDTYLGEYPLTNRPHTKIAKIDSAVTNLFKPYTETNQVWIDMMIKPRLWDEENEPAMSNALVAVYFGTDGYIRAWCSIYTNGAEYPEPASWLKMDHPPIGTDDWIRLTIELRYNWPDGGDYSYYAMQLNSADPIVNYWGMEHLTFPDCMNTHTGPWLICDWVYQTNIEINPWHDVPLYITSLGFSGSGYIDDLVITNEQPHFIPPHTIYASADIGGSITPYGSVTISEGRNAYFSISAKQGYDGTNVVVDGMSKGWITNYLFTNVISDHTIAVYTKPQPRYLTVVTPYGTPNPAGTNLEYDYWTMITCSVSPSAYSMGTGTQLACLGWSRTVSSPGSGSGTSTAFRITGASSTEVTTVTWNWGIQFWLDTGVSGNGMVDVGDGWRNSNDTVYINAIGINGGQWDHWSGDTNGVVGLETNMIMVTMDQSRKIVAHFVGGPQFTSHGTPYEWILYYYPGTTDYEAQDMEDTDNDGLKTWEEYIAGTDPTNTASVFIILDQGYADGSNRVTFYGTTNSGLTVPFGMRFSTNLISGDWILVDHNIPRSSDSGTNVWWHVSPPVGVPAFYRPVATNSN